MSKKIYIFEELNYIFFPLALFQKIIGKEVYFFRLIKKWQNRKKINFFESIGLKRLNFQDFEILKRGEISLEGAKLQKEFGKFLDKLDIYNFLSKKLEEMGCDQDDLKCLILSKFCNQARYFCGISQFIDYQKKNGINNFVVFVRVPDLFEDLLIKKFENRAKLINFNYFYFSTLFLGTIFKNIRFKKSKTSKRYIEYNETKNIDLKKFKVIFFPHQGIFYGNFYKKDQFYSTKENSNFYPKNILHLSIADQDTHNSETNDFYKTKQIINIDFVTLGNLSFKEIMNEIFAFIKKYYFSSKNTLFSISFFLYFWILIKRSVKRLNALKNVKTAIIGYDLVVPREILIACKIKKIKTIATQERLLGAWLGESFIMLDHYLVINEKAKNFIANNIVGKVKKIKTIGPVRSDLIKKKILNEKINSDEVILVLDTSSEKSHYSNGLLFHNTWKQNFVFYRDIIKLAKKNKNNKLILKGKDYYFMDIPYFEKIKNEINQTSNIQLYDNKNSAYKLLENIILTITRPTSVVDELLFKDRSLIIYEIIEGYPTSLFDYGKNLTVRNYEELENKFNLFQKNIKEFEKNLKTDSNKLFTNKSEKKVYDILHEYLEKEFDYYIN